MNLLITGGSGFIGKKLLLKLPKRNIKTLLLLRKKSKQVKIHKNSKILYDNLNLNNSSFKKIYRFQPTIIIHLAWEGIPNYTKMKSSKNLFDQKKFFKKILKISSIKKIIVTGSSFEYDKLNFTSKYFIWAKNTLRNFLDRECKNKKIFLNWLRIFYVYGPGQKEGSLIPYIFLSKIKNKKLVLKTPNSSHDFINVNDVVDLIIKCISLKNNYGTFDVGTGKSIKVKYIKNFIDKIFSSKKKIKGHFKFNKNKLTANLKKTSHYLKWKPKISLDKGLYQLKNYYLKS